MIRKRFKEASSRKRSLYLWTNGSRKYDNTRYHRISWTYSLPRSRLSPRQEAGTPRSSLSPPQGGHFSTPPPPPPRCGHVVRSSSPPRGRHVVRSSSQPRGGHTVFSLPRHEEGTLDVPHPSSPWGVTTLIFVILTVLILVSSRLDLPLNFYDKISKDLFSVKVQINPYKTVMVNLTTLLSQLYDWF